MISPARNTVHLTIIRKTVMVFTHYVKRVYNLYIQIVELHKLATIHMEHSTNVQSMLLGTQQLSLHKSTHGYPFS